MSRSKKILGPESSPSVGRRLIKFPSSKLKKFIVKPDLSRQECITQICPVSSLQLNRNSLRLRALQPHHADGMADGMADLFSLVNLTWLLQYRHSDEHVNFAFGKKTGQPPPRQRSPGPPTRPMP